MTLDEVVNSSVANDSDKRRLPKSQAVLRVEEVKILSVKALARASYFPFLTSSTYTQMLDSRDDQLLFSQQMALKRLRMQHPSPVESTQTIAPPFPEQAYLSLRWVNILSVEALACASDLHIISKSTGGLAHTDAHTEQLQLLQRATTGCTSRSVGSGTGSPYPCTFRSAIEQPCHRAKR